MDGPLTDSLSSSHVIRYVLKDKTTNEPLFVVIFTLVPKEEVEKEGKAIEAEQNSGSAKDGAKGDGKSGATTKLAANTTEDDLD